MKIEELMTQIVEACTPQDMLSRGLAQYGRQIVGVITVLAIRLQSTRASSTRVRRGDAAERLTREN